MGMSMSTPRKWILDTGATKNCKLGVSNLLHTSIVGGKGTYGSPAGKALDQTSLLRRRDNLAHSVLPLHNLNRLEVLAIAQPLLDKLDHTPPGNTIQNNLIPQRRSDKLQLALLAPHQSKEVTRSRLSNLRLISQQPKDLVIPQPPRLLLRHQTRPVIRAHLRESESPRPRAHSIVLRGEQLHAARRLGQLGHVGSDDEEHSLLGGLDAQLGLCADHRGAEVEELARVGLGEEFRAVDGDELLDQLLDLGGVEGGERDARGGHEEAAGVAVGAEEAELAVVAAVGLEALEALGGVVEHRGGGHDGEGAVGLEFRRRPAGVDVPGAGDHVVGCEGGDIADGVVEGGDGAGGGCAGADELGGVEGREGGCAGELLLHGVGDEVGVSLHHGLGRRGGYGGGRHEEGKWGVIARWYAK